MFSPADTLWVDWLGTNDDSNSLAPYERRIIELLRNSKDKRARKLAKKKVGTLDGFLYRITANRLPAGHLRPCQGEG